MPIGVVTSVWGTVTLVVLLGVNCLLDLARLLGLAGLFIFIKVKRSNSSLLLESFDLVLLKAPLKGICCESSIRRDDDDTDESDDELFFLLIKYGIDSGEEDLSSGCVVS